MEKIIYNTPTKSYDIQHPPKEQKKLYSNSSSILLTLPMMRKIILLIRISEKYLSQHIL